MCRVLSSSKFSRLLLLSASLDLPCFASQELLSSDAWLLAVLNSCYDKRYPWAVKPQLASRVDPGGGPRRVLRETNASHSRTNASHSRTTNLQLPGRRGPSTIRFSSTVIGEQGGPRRSASRAWCARLATGASPLRPHSG